MIHVDTSFLVDLIREQKRRIPGPATAFLESRAGEAIGMSVFVLCELEAGASRAVSPDRERARLRVLAQALTVAYPDERFAPTYGDLLGRVLAGGRSISTMDLLIATAAVVDDAGLVTANTKHFQVVPGLSVISYRKVPQP